MITNRNELSLSRRGGIVQGCLIALVLLLILSVAVGVYVFLNARNWTAAGMKKVAEQAITQSDLPKAEKPEIVAVFDEFADAFKEGDVTWEELVEVFKDPDKSPVFAMGMVLQFEGAYVKASGLSDEEKEAAKLPLNRVAQGLSDGRLNWDQATSILKPVTKSNGEDKQELLMPDETTDDQIREVIANAQAAVAKAEITDEFKEIDLSEAFREHIEDRIGRKIGEKPSDE